MEWGNFCRARKLSKVGFGIQTCSPEGHELKRKLRLSDQKFQNNFSMLLMTLALVRLLVPGLSHQNFVDRSALGFQSSKKYLSLVHTTIGKRIKHRTNQYLNNRTEQSHRPVKQRYYPMLGFGAFPSAAIICRGIDELRNFFRPRSRIVLSLSQKRSIRASKNYSLAKMILKF